MKILIIDVESNVEEIGTVHELFLARNQLWVIDQGYQDLGLPTPEWIADRQLDVDREITLRVKSDLQRRLKAAKARRSALGTAEEKRNILDDEIKELEKTLQS